MAGALHLAYDSIQSLGNRHLGARFWGQSSTVLHRRNFSLGQLGRAK